MNVFEKYNDIGILILRLFIGIRLIYGVQDNIFHWERMKEFEGFLTQFKFPLPLVSAIVSVYVQALAGVLFIVGWKTRWAAAVMIFNFTVAIVMVHINSKENFEQMTAPLFMLVTSIAILFTGAGKYSLGKK